jgi:hypothetical protein
MFLTINDQWVLKNINQQKSPFLQEELIDIWGCWDEIDKELHESWRTR